MVTVDAMFHVPTEKGTRDTQPPPLCPDCGGEGGSEEERGERAREREGARGIVSVD